MFPTVWALKEKFLCHEKKLINTLNRNITTNKIKNGLKNFIFLALILQ